MGLNVTLIKPLKENNSLDYFILDIKNSKQMILFEKFKDLIVFKDFEYDERECSQEDYDYLTYKEVNNEALLVLTKPVLYYENITDIGKGCVNKKFYEDGNWSDEGYIITKEEAEEHYVNYFSKNLYDDYNLYRDEILSRFIENETIICYW